MRFMRELTINCHFWRAKNIGSRTSVPNECQALSKPLKFMLPPELSQAPISGYRHLFPSISWYVVIQFFSDYIMIVCCFKIHEIHLTSLSLFLQYLGPFHEPRTSCQQPLRRVDARARAPCRNGKRTTTLLQLLWKLVDFGLAKRGGVMLHCYRRSSLSFFYLNIVCLSSLPCLNQHIFVFQWNDFSDLMWDCLRERSNMWRGFWSGSK